MSILKIKAKVQLPSEEAMEIEESYDMGNIVNAKQAEWVWRNIGVPVEEVYKIIAFSKDKTLVQMYDNERILVNESFKTVFERWRELRENHPERIGDHKEEQEEQEEEEE